MLLYAWLQLAWCGFAVWVGVGLAFFHDEKSRPKLLGTYRHLLTPFSIFLLLYSTFFNIIFIIFWRVL